MCYDKVFCDLFKLGDTFSVTEENDEPAARNSLTYSEVCAPPINLSYSQLKTATKLIEKISTLIPFFLGRG